MLNDQMRGHYGLSPFVVIRSTLVILILFAVVYFIIGKMKIAWGMVMPISVLGEPIEDTDPKFITTTMDTSSGSYVLDCLTFSLDQILVVGTQMFRIPYVIERFRVVPRRYVSIGIGKLVASVENLVGLILLYFFILAFIRIL